ncbi:MAG: BolA/IbaG family iron-sulfur metabolism protein [Acidobacteriota bacterium]
MALRINRPAAETTDRIRKAIEAALPGAEVEATGMGGHFEIRVVSEAFEGKNTLAKHRLVLGAIAELMKGENAPVHAVDKIEALVPRQD